MVQLSLPKNSTVTEGKIFIACVYRKLNPNVLMMKSTQDSERT